MDLLTVSLAILSLSYIHGLMADRCSVCGYGTTCTKGDCTCWNGFELKQWSYSQRAFVCQDRNECVGRDHVCKTGTTCVNRDGSYDCQCLRGLFGPWVTKQGNLICTEKSLCETNYHRCGQGTRCVTQNMTSYKCMCGVGFKSLTISKKDEIYKCVDIDECTERKREGPVCGVNSICTNTIGSFRCRCVQGFRSAWKDDMNCDMTVVNGRGGGISSLMFKIGLAVGVTFVVSLGIMAVLCYAFRMRKRPRNGNEKIPPQREGQPLKISVQTGRESSYVNVLLTSSDTTGNTVVDRDDKRADKNNKKHIYANETFGLEVSLLKNSHTKPDRQCSVTIPDTDEVYVNRDTIKRVRRSHSQQEPRRTRVKTRRPLSECSTARTVLPVRQIKGFSQIQSKICIDEDKRFFPVPEDYDHLQRAGTVLHRTTNKNFKDHIYACPDENEDGDESECSSVSNGSEQQTNGTIQPENDTELNTPVTIYEPVTYSVPHKKTKTDRIYVNQTEKN